MRPDGRRASRRALAALRPAPVALLLALAAPLPALAEPQLLPAESRRDEYAETFTFLADLDDGGYLQVQLAVTNIGPGSGTGICRALVTRPGAAAWTAHERVRRSGWRHAADAAGETLTVGPCSARTGERTTVRAELAGRTVELTFPEPLRERAAATTVELGDRSYRATVLQAFTPVEVRLGGFDAAGPLGGGGYADHSRSDVPPTKLASGWVRFRALRPPHRLLLLGRRTAGGGYQPAWIWREGGAPWPLQGLGLARAPGQPAGWRVALPGQPEGELASEALLFRHSPAQELGALGALVGAVMDLPVTRTYRARLGGAAPVEGILEITTVGEDAP